MCNVLNRMKNQFLDFWVMAIFLLKTANFRWIFTIIRIIKVGKLIFHLIQRIAAHLSLKLEQNWEGGGGGLHILSWIKAKFWDTSILKMKYFEASIKHKIDLIFNDAEKVIGPVPITDMQTDWFFLPSLRQKMPYIHERVRRIYVDPPLSEILRFLWKIRNVLKRMKN